MGRLWDYCAFCGKRIETGEKCWGLPNGESVCTDCCVAENDGADGMSLSTASFTASALTVEKKWKEGMQMRLIDADALIADSCRDCPEELRKRCKTEPACADTKFLFEIPTVDAVPVVYCKNCQHYDMGVCLKIYSDGNVHSAAWQKRKPDDFCSYGEREEGAEC